MQPQALDSHTYLKGWRRVVCGLRKNTLALWICSITWSMRRCYASAWCVKKTPRVGAGLLVGSKPVHRPPQKTSPQHFGSLDNSLRGSTHEPVLNRQPQCRRQETLKLGRTLYRVEIPCQHESTWEVVFLFSLVFQFGLVLDASWLLLITVLSARVLPSCVYAWRWVSLWPIWRGVSWGGERCVMERWVMHGQVTLVVFLRIIEVFPYTERWSDLFGGRLLLGLPFGPLWSFQQLLPAEHRLNKLYI